MVNEIFTFGNPVWDTLPWRCHSQSAKKQNWLSPDNQFFKKQTT